MWFSNWLRFLSQSSRKIATRPRARLTLEVLENRTVPSASALDPTFGAGGLAVQFNGYGPLSGSNAVVLQPDGKILVSCFFEGATKFSEIKAGLARYNTDGTLDTTFGNNGLDSVQPVWFGDAKDLVVGPNVALQKDGMILISGVYFDYTLNYYESGFVARLKANGDLDTSFGTNGIVTGFGFGEGSGPALAVRSDGDIIVVDGAVHALTSTGTSPGASDDTFGTHGSTSLDFNAYGVAVQSDGSIVVAGDKSGEIFVTRLTSSGQPDLNFGSSGTETVDFDPGHDAAAGVAIQSTQSNNRIIVAGYSYDADGNNPSFVVAGLRSEDGSLDNSFGDNGTGKHSMPISAWDAQAYDAQAYGLAVQPDDKIVLVGEIDLTATSHDAFAVARFSSDGSPDGSFGTDALFGIDGLTTISDPSMPDRNADAAGVAIQPDGKIVVAGYSGHLMLARFEGDDLMTQATATDQLSQFISTADLSGQSDTVTLQARNQDDVNAILAALDGNGLPSATTALTVAIDLGGDTYSTNGAAVNPPANVAFVIQNGTLDPAYPALTVAGGNVTVLNCTLLTTGDAPTIFVTGGYLTLRNVTIEESTGGNDAAIRITGGTLDLGTADSPGGNTINVNGDGRFIFSTGSALVTTSSTAFQIDGVTLPLDAIAALISQVAALNLNSGQQNSLVSTLQAAQKSLTNANTTAAVNQLSAFVNQISALVNSHRLDLITADSLVDLVNDFIDDIR